MLDFVLGQTEPELTSTFTPEVTPVQRAAFGKEFAHFRESVRTNKVDLVKVQTVLQSISEVTSDKKFTPEEVARLRKEMSEAVKAK